MASNCPACTDHRYHTPAEWVFHPDAGKGVNVLESGKLLLSASGNPPGAAEPRQATRPPSGITCQSGDGTQRRVAEMAGGSPSPPPVPLPLIQYCCPDCGGIERVTALMSIPFHKHPYGPGELQIAQIPLRRIQ